MLKIAIGADHRGYEQKSIIQHGVTLDTRRIDWIDVGCFNAERTDYPPFAYDVVMSIKSGRAELGILLCGTGAGMAIAANRFAKIYAALAWDVQTAIRAREEDNANVLVLPSDYISAELAIEMVDAWLNAKFLDNRYEKRVEMIDSWNGL